MAGRRKTRKSVQTDSDREAAEDNASQTADHTSPATNTNQLPADIDYAVLSNLLPEINLDAPNNEAVLHIYKLILAQHEQLEAKDREIDNYRAELEKKDIETDQLLQDRESSEKELEMSLENMQNELKQVKKEKDELGASCESLKAQVTRLSSSQSTSSSELSLLQRKIEDVEREKRDLVIVIDRMKDDTSQRDEELHILRDNLKAARKEQQGLETEIRELRFTETSTKFRIETLTQQLSLAQDENTRLNDDLSSRNEEFSKLRREKQTELVQLQASFDSLTQNHNQITTAYRSLQSLNATQSLQLAQTSHKVQDLTGQLADQEAKYSSEAANLRRLIEMMEEREAQAKLLVSGIEEDWAGLGEKAAAREQELRRELEEAEQRVESLEKQLNDTQLVLDKINRGELPIPSGIDRPFFASDGTKGLEGLSPGLAMISRMQKSGRTFTEVYADYVRLQEELAQKNVEYDRMDRTLAEVLAQIEERAPVLAEQRNEFDRLQTESLSLASELADVLSQRDVLASRAEELAQKITGTEKENHLLQQQLVDVGRQVQALLREISRRDDPSIPDDNVLENVHPKDPTDDIISNNIVLFCSIPSLQEQNQRLLRVTRDLAARLDSDDREYKEVLDREQQEAIQEAHEAIQVLQSQLRSQQKSHQMTVQAYIRERDALKSLLARSEKVGQLAAESSTSVSGQVPVSTSSEQELRTVQSEFDTYREEVLLDTSKLSQDVTDSRQEAVQLSAALAKANARIEYLTDRQRAVQEQSVDQARQYGSLSERNQQLYDQYTRLLAACTQTNEELSIANGSIDRLRNECANLRAEKKIWDSVQTRLLEENKTLAIERSRLSDLMTNIQKMHNDVERFGENDKRRMETQVQALEVQVQDLRSQLSREQDAVRQIALQKDLETRDMRIRTDRLSDDLSKARESLVAAETSQKHLQDRLSDFTKQLQTSEEKLAVYERRGGSHSSLTEGSSSVLSKEQQLESEVAELRGTLRAAKTDLNAARSHIQQFQEISQASESALASLTTTYDDYKSKTEGQILQYESQIKALQHNLEVKQSEMSAISEKNLGLQQTLERERVSFAEDKRVLEDIIVERTNTEVHSRNDQVGHQSEIRSLEEQIKVAEEKHSREVLAHAETIKVMDNLKDDLNSVRLAARESKTAAETAQSSLKNSEESWRRQKEALDKEISDITKRCQDLTSQNDLLHQHLESVSTQAVRIRETADVNTTGLTDAPGSEDAEGKLAELRSVVTYLRKEKGIVDLQLELSKQESARRKAHADQLAKSLDDARSTLSAERERVAEILQQSTQHNELVEKINQLNILRESNATLRTESEANSRRAKILEERLSQLTAELEPIKEELSTSRALLEEKNRQITRLEEENRQWKERNTQLLTKYERIDPSDVQALRDEIEDLQIDIRKYEEAQATHKKETEEKDKLLETTSSTLADFRSKYQRLVQESRNRLGTLNSQVAKLNETVTELRKEVAELSVERDQLKEQRDSITAAPGSTDLQVMKSELEALKQEKANLEQKYLDDISVLKRDHTAALSALQAEKGALGSSTSNTVAEHATEESWTGEKKLLQNALDEALAQAKAAEERAEKISNEIKNIRMQNEKFQARLLENEKRRAAESERLEALTAKHRQEQEEAVTAATTRLRAELQSSVETDFQTGARHTTELQALEQRLRAEHQSELQTALENAKLELATVPDQRSNDVKSVTEKELEEQLKAATERGRLESAAKLKLKDTLLAKTQNNLKQLEAKVQGWIESGLIPTEATSATPSKAPALSTPSSNSGNTSTNSNSAVPSSSNSATATQQTLPGQATLPRRPSVPAAAASAAVKATVDNAGRGAPGARAVRGIARGSVRGRGVGRGAAAGVVTAVPPNINTTASPETSSSGMSIMGAAAKRPREDAEASPALSKRLKPVEGTGKPVALRRPQAEPSAPS